MNMDLAAAMMGLAALVIFLGYSILRKRRRRTEKEEILAEYTCREQEPAGQQEGKSRQNPAQSAGKSAGKEENTDA